MNIQESWMDKRIHRS